MRDFAALLDGLAFTPSRGGKQRLIGDYLDRVPDPDRGYGLAALTGDLRFDQVKPAAIRALIAGEVDPALFALSYDYVGDLAETVSLLWPRTDPGGKAPGLAEVVQGFRGASRAAAPGLLRAWLATLDESGRHALLKLVTGGLRVGVSARLAKSALSEWGQVNISDIEELWHGFDPPYEDIFRWLTHRADRPVPTGRLLFRPLMLAHPLVAEDRSTLAPADFRAEYKWDGARVQLSCGDGRARLFSRSGEDVGAAFPDLVEPAATLSAVLDGELLVAEPGAQDQDGPACGVRPFGDLQKRLNRKRADARLLREFPARLRLYDMLFEDGRDLRALPFDTRRRHLQHWYDRYRPEAMDLSPLLPFADWDDLERRRRGLRDAAIEGLMLKRGDSPYLPGRPKGHWFKWKRDPLTLDCVLVYAQRGHGRRSSLYSDFTFGVWRPAAGGRELVPVGKAYFGFTDEELARLDRWVQEHTVQRFGPVREVQPRLVLEIAFDSVQRSRRHKSGLAMRFPRIFRIRWDKSAEEADSLASLEAMLPRRD